MQSNSLKRFEWKQLVTNPNFWLAVTLIGLEVSFAAPGLLNLLPPTMAKEYRLIIFAGCGLFSTVNLALAWSEAIKEVETEAKQEAQLEQAKADFEKKQQAYLQGEQYQEDRETIKKRRQQRGKIAELKTQYGEVSAQLTSLRSQIQRCEKDLAKHTEQALKECQRWERNVRLWELFNLKKVRQYQTTSDNYSNFHSISNNHNGQNSNYPKYINNSEKQQP